MEVGSACVSSHRLGRRRAAGTVLLVGVLVATLHSLANPDPMPAPVADSAPAVPGTATDELSNVIEFNHKAHIEKGGMSCTKCHGGTEKRARASFPPDVYCEACHASPRTDSAEEAKLIELLDAGKPLVWNQVTRLAPHVYFSHRRHVVSGNIDCAVCHGDVGKRTTSVETPAVDFARRPGMSRCINCHQDSGSRFARIDCVDCHR